MFSRIRLLGVAICRDTPPQNADPSGYGVLTRGAERREALAGCGGGAPRNKLSMLTGFSG
jgi:hypothetical protein